jgi:hypothetical protein
MRVALAGFVRGAAGTFGALLALVALAALAGCVRNAEGVVREQAATAFTCADYALVVEEVGPDVYRASGCGQELIYACKPSAPRPGQVADVGDEAVMECARRPN